MRSKLEYASVIWNPFHTDDIEMIEKVQRKFVKQLFYRKLIPNSPNEWDYTACCDLLNIETIEQRRIVNGLVFAVKSLKKLTDSQEYIHFFNINEQASQVKISRWLLVCLH